MMRFFENESLGQCTPRRVGTAKAVWDAALLEGLSLAMAESAICRLDFANEISDD